MRFIRELWLFAAGAAGARRLFLIVVQRAFGHMRQGAQTLVDHIPQAHGQMVAVAAVDGHALEAVAVVRTGLLAGAVVARLANLTQEFHLHFIGFLLVTLPVQLVLPDGQLVAVDLHLFLLLRL